MVSGRKLVSVDHRPARAISPCEIRGLVRILAASRIRGKVLYLDTVVPESRFNAGDRLRHGKRHAPTCILPGLGHREATHGMTGTHPGADIGADKQGSIMSFAHLLLVQQVALLGKYVVVLEARLDQFP